MKSFAFLSRLLLVAVCVTGLIVWEVFRLKSDQSRRPATTADPNRGLIDCGWEKTIRPLRPGEMGFTDVTDALGLDFEHVVGPLGTYFMPESIGAGGALADFNGNGRLDLYLVNCGPSPQSPTTLPPGTRFENRLFLQAEDGTLVDATEESGLGDLGYGAGCAVGDVNNDGHLDIYITNYGADQLYLNNGDGTFTNVTVAAGIDQTGWGVCASFVDYNRNGRLDLVIVNYTADETYGHSVACGFRHGLVSYCGPHKFAPTVDRLLRNDGVRTTDDGRSVIQFTDVTTEAGLTQDTTYGFGVVCADFNGDGWPDIFIANDGAPNRLWINQQDGTFLEQATAYGVAYNGDGAAEAGMGVAVGDLNEDGRFDLVVTHLSTETTTLYLSDGGGNFLDATTRYGLGQSTMAHTGWGVALQDFDHDGHSDLPIVNGLVVPCHSGFPFHGEDQFQLRQDTIDNPTAFWRDYADTNLLLMGQGDAGFVINEILGGDFSRAIASGRGLIYGDIDGDGDLDLVVTNCGGRARIYKNDLPKRGHWLMIRAFDPALARDAYGAEITVVAGGRRFLRLANPASSYLASNDPRVHVGLGDAGEYDEIVVRWPDGPVEQATEVFPGGRADRHITLKRGTGRPYPYEEQP